MRRAGEGRGRAEEGLEGKVYPSLLFCYSTMRLIQLMNRSFQQ